MAQPTQSLTPVRASLRRLSDRLPDTLLTLVVAPAGSGKTTLLAAWREDLRAAERMIAWFDVSPPHADVAIFLHDLVAALGKLAAGLGDETLRVLANVRDPESDWRLVLRALQREIEALPQPVILFLDNFQHLPAGAVPTLLLSDLLRTMEHRREHLPLRIVIATRGAVPEASARLRAGGFVLDVSDTDLSLRADEITAILASCGVAPEVDLVASILARTHGWAIGVLLAAQALAQIPAGTRLTFTRGLDQQVDMFEYVASEVVADSPPAMVRLLEAAALAGHGDLALLRELYELWVRPVSETAASVTDLVREALHRGLLQRDGAGYAVHPLWQDLLRKRLRSELGPADWMRLRLQAAKVLAAHGHIEAALAAYCDGEAWGDAITLLVAVGDDWLAQQHHAQLVELLGRIPAERVEQSAAALHLLGRALSRSDPNRALASLTAAADVYRETSRPLDELGVLRSLTILAYSEHQLAHVRDGLRRILALRTSTRDRSLRGTMLTTLSTRSYLLGRYAGALYFAERSQRYPLDVLELWMTATIRRFTHEHRGEWDLALEVVDAALADRRVGEHVPAYYNLLSQKALLAGLLGNPRAALADMRACADAFKEYRLTRYQAVSAQGEAQLLAALGERDKALDMYARAGRLNRQAGNAAAEAMLLAQASVWAWRWGEAERAANDARAAVELYVGCLDRGATFNLRGWYLAYALFVVARSGDPRRAMDLCTRYRPHLEQPDLPLVQHVTLMILADVARVSGARTANRYARDAWAVAARAGLRWVHPDIAPEVSAWTGREALRQGIPADYVVRQIERRCPDAMPELLNELRATAPAKVKTLAKKLSQGQPATPGYAIRIESLGCLRVRRGYEQAHRTEWRGSMARRLLSRLLVAEGRPVSREELQNDLWPDADIEAARNNLRVALANLNHVLEPTRPRLTRPSFLSRDDGMLQIRTEAGVEWDVTSFRGHIEVAESVEGANDVQAVIDHYKDAISLYAGPLLPEIVYEDWVLPLRTRLAERFLAAGHRLCTLLHLHGRGAEVVAVAERLIQEDAGDEPSWTFLMRAHLEAGDRAAALRAYQQATERLSALVDAEPGPALRALAARARDERSPSGH